MGVRSSEVLKCWSCLSQSQEDVWRAGQRNHPRAEHGRAVCARAVHVNGLRVPKRAAGGILAPYPPHPPPPNLTHTHIHTPLLSPDSRTELRRHTKHPALNGEGEERERDTERNELWRLPVVNLSSPDLNRSEEHWPRGRPDASLWPWPAAAREALDLKAPREGRMVARTGGALWSWAHYRPQAAAAAFVTPPPPLRIPWRQQQRRHREAVPALPDDEAALATGADGAACARSHGKPRASLLHGDLSVTQDQGYLGACVRAFICAVRVTRRWCRWEIFHSTYLSTLVGRPWLPCTPATSLYLQTHTCARTHTPTIVSHYLLYCGLCPPEVTGFMCVHGLSVISGLSLIELDCGSLCCASVCGFCTPTHILSSIWWGSSNAAVLMTLLTGTGAVRVCARASALNGSGVPSPTGEVHASSVPTGLSVRMPD